MIVKLTQEQIEARGQVLANLEMTYEADKQTYAEQAKGNREALKWLRDQITQLSREINAGEVEEEDQLAIWNGPDEPDEIDNEPDPFIDGPATAEAADVTVPDDDDF